MPQTKHTGSSMSNVRYGVILQDISSTVISYHYSSHKNAGSVGYASRHRRNGQNIFWEYHILILKWVQNKKCQNLEYSYLQRLTQKFQKYQNVCTFMCFMEHC
jgi:hypothetical protein